MPSPIEDLEEVADLVSIAIARERASIKIYANAYEKSTSDNAKRIFSLLIEQDKAHEAQLRAQLQELKSEIDLERLRIKRRTQ